MEGYSEIMPESRHYTTVDDWVALNPRVTHTEFRVYVLLKGKLIHGPGGVPETGFRSTAAWVSKLSNGIFSVSTVHRATQGLALKGILRRLNDPKGGGEGAEFEFVVHPEDSYEGSRSIMARAAEIEKTATRGVAFSVVPLSGHPSNGTSKIKHPEPSRGLGMDDSDDFAPFPGEADESPGEFGPDLSEGLDINAADKQVEPEFDMSGLDATKPMKTPVTEFAEALEDCTAGLTDVKLRLMAGQCARIAEKAAPALALGWEPKELAKRLSAELNPHIRLPEQLLISKISDLGGPPKTPFRGDLRGIDEVGKKAEPLKSPGAEISRREGRKVISPEEQERVRQMQEEYAARRKGGLRSS